MRKNVTSKGKECIQFPNLSPTPVPGGCIRFPNKPSPIFCEFFPERSVHLALVAPSPPLQPPPGEGGKFLPLALELAGLGHTEPSGPPHLVHASGQAGPNPRAHTPAGRCGSDSTLPVIQPCQRPDRCGSDFKVSETSPRGATQSECRAVADNGDQTLHLWWTNGRLCSHQVLTTWHLPGPG